MNLRLDRCEPSPSLVAKIWRSVQPSPAEERSARRSVQCKAGVILALLAASYIVLVVSSVAWPLRMLAAAGLAISLVAVGTGIMHDANHGSFARWKWVNHSLAYTADALGASSWLWRIQHNTLHHGNTNVVGFDADIALAPLARLAPSQPWRRWHRGQHIYMWPLYGFLTLKNLLFSDLVALVHRRMDVQPLRKPVTVWVVARITLGKLLHVGWAIVLPLAFNPWWAVLVFYLACSWLVGFILAVTFQLAHCVDGAEFPAAIDARRGDDFFVHQLRTTCNVASPVPVLGHAFRWLVGSLDHQIEHHMAPRLPHTLYPKISRRFREACQQHGITYRLQPGVWAALRAHGRLLHTLGSPRAVVSGV